MSKTSDFLEIKKHAPIKNCQMKEEIKVEIANC